MKLFLDTADLATIRRGHATGLVSGVTTNPTHIAKTGRVFEELIKDVCAVGLEHVSVEAVADTTAGLIAEARRIAAWSERIVVKIPMTRDGLCAVPVLEQEHGIRTNVTMVFSPTQAWLAMKAGASFVSLVLSRLENIGAESHQLIEDVVTIKRHYGFRSEILAASIKSQPTLLHCLRLGVDIATIPEDLFRQLYQHPLTESGLIQFAQDWAKVCHRPAEA